MSRRDAPPIGGTVEPGFEAVEDAFRTNFAERGELGAACAVSHWGELVVDLWGGYRDASRTDPWTKDTLVLMFSTTKGLAAAVVAQAHAVGLFRLTDRLADHWPAFGQCGKAEITIREVLAQQAGLAAIDATLTPEMIADRETLIDLLARKRPDWNPGSRHGYHAWSLGWYESELLRRIDPAKRTLSAYFAEEIAEPLDIEFYFGLPETVAPERVAEIQGFSIVRMLASLGDFPPRMVLALLHPYSITSKALSPFAMRSPVELNDPAYRSVEIPAGNGIGQVRDVARLYGLLAVGGKAVGLDATTFENLVNPGTSPTDGPRDVVLKTDTSYSAGYWKPFTGFRFGSPAAFGAPGAGGSFAFADPRRKLGFAYAPNRMGTHIWNDPRERALRTAVFDCLDGQ